MNNLFITYLGGSQAGIVGLLTLMSMGHRIFSMVAYDEINWEVARQLGVSGLYDSVTKIPLESKINKSDLLVSVHGREFVTNEIIGGPRFGAINVHPCLYAYKGANPIKRMLRDKTTKASVGVHYMTDVIDEGEVITELYVDVKGCKTPDGVYNRLYPYYSLALMEAINKICI